MSGHPPDDTDILLADIPMSGARDANNGPARSPLLTLEDIATSNGSESKPSSAPKGWPTRARAVRITPFTLASTIIVDVLLLTLPIAFLAFAISVQRFDQVPTANHMQAKRVLIALSRAGPSVFPLLFAAVIGRLTHAVLLWRLEKGASIGILDLLAGSTSLTSTVTSQVQLRKISILSVILVLVWSLSPIGGQASIRQLGFGNGTSEETFALAYLRPASTGRLYAWSYMLTNLQLANALFVAALLSPIESRNSTVDLWNNVKIPLLETYENSTIPDVDGWYNASVGQPTYSSIVGVPVAGYRQEQNATSVFNMETSYFRLGCPYQEHGGTW